MEEGNLWKVKTDTSVGYCVSMEAALRFAAAMEKLGRNPGPVEETNERRFREDQGWGEPA